MSGQGVSRCANKDAIVAPSLNAEPWVAQSGLMMASA
jgi:hypothetical protein